MAGDGQLREWVSDKLMSLLGYSKSVVVQYVIRLGMRPTEFRFLLLDSVTPQIAVVLNMRSHACVFASTAKECSSTGDLVGKLVEFGFTSSVETRTFAADIYAKVPRRASGISVRIQFLT
jgi:pre-mRNA-splicing factor ATP-dependent RNA helicase DHX16